MESKYPEDNYCNTETDEETVALRKKRSRRVSFAETTAVRFFSRDDESETPPSSESRSGQGLRRTGSEEIREFLRRDECGGDNDGDRDGEDEDDVAVKRSFFRPMESPSPGCGFGSATSNDEDNFFGPVSADFIKPGRLSDSAASDENHDVTMDSTAFSMHFRSLARSESGDIKTLHAPGEKTPTQTTTPTGFENVMLLTGHKNMTPQSSSPVKKTACASGDSSDMSLVGENSHKYDYGRLSPELGALLAEGSEDLQAIPLDNPIAGSNSTVYLEMGKESCKDAQHGSPYIPEPCHMTDRSHMSTDLVSSLCGFKDVATDPCTYGATDQRTQDASVSKDPLDSENCIDGQILTPYQQNGVSLSVDKKSTSDSEQVGKQKTEFLSSSTLSKLYSEEQIGFISTASIPTLENKRRQIFKDVINSSVNGSYSTQLQNVMSSIHAQERGKGVQSLPSLGKSISRIESLKPLCLSSSLKNRLKNSVLAPLACHSKPPTISVSPMNASLDQMRKLDAPVVCLEEQFSRVAMNNEGERSTGKAAVKEFRPNVNPVVTVGSGQAADVSEVRETSHQATGSLFVDVSREDVHNGASPSWFHRSGEKEPENLLLQAHTVQKNLQSMGTESSLLGVTLNSRKHEKGTGLSDDLDHSPKKSSNAVVAQILENQVSFSGSLSYPSSLNVDTDGHLNKKTDDASRKTLQTGDLSSLTIRTEPSTRPSSFVFDCSENIDEGNIVHGEIVLSGLLHCPGSSGCMQTLLRTQGSENYHIPNNAVQTSGSSSMSVVQSSLMSEDFQEELDHQSSTKESCTLSAENSLIPSETKSVPSDGNMLKVGNGCYDLQQPLSSDGTNSTGLKRKYEELDGGAEKASIGSTSDQELLKVHNSAAMFRNGCSGLGSKIVEKIGGDKRIKNGDDIFNCFSNFAKNMFSRSVSKLDMQEIEKLEDIVTHLQKAKSNQVLSKMCSQKVSEGVCYSQIRKVADTRLLLYRTLYEKVKLQLMHIKRDMLLNRTQMLQSALQKCEEMKSKFSKALLGGQIDTLIDGPTNSWAVCCDGEKALDEGMSTLRDSLEDSSRKIDKLINFFHSSLKMKGESNCKATVKFVMDHFRKKASCLHLQHELHLWEVDSIENKVGSFNVALNYFDFINQRFKSNNKRTSTIAISIDLNSVKILKTWPNVDAYNAFKFVLSGKTMLEYTSPSIFAQETQRTSLLLCTVLDILEEVMAARIEIKSLVESNFCSPSATRLDLWLTFINYSTARRVTLKVDLSCLSCGVYPSEITPYEVVEVGPSQQQKPISQPMLADIASSMDGLRGGCKRILRLCRCVSNLFSSKKY